MDEMMKNIKDAKQVGLRLASREQYPLNIGASFRVQNDDYEMIYIVGGYFHRYAIVGDNILPGESYSLSPGSMNTFSIGRVRFFADLLPDNVRVRVTSHRGYILVQLAQSPKEKFDYLFD